MNVDIFGYFAAILTTAAFLPQLIKTLKTKKADDVSLTTLIMFIIGVLSVSYTHLTLPTSVPV